MALDVWSHPGTMSGLVAPETIEKIFEFMEELDLNHHREGPLFDTVLGSGTAIHSLAMCELQVGTERLLLLLEKAIDHRRWDGLAKALTSTGAIEALECHSRGSVERLIKKLDEASDGRKSIVAEAIASNAVAYGLITCHFSKKYAGGKDYGL